MATKNLYQICLHHNGINVFISTSRVTYGTFENPFEAVKKAAEIFGNNKTVRIIKVVS